MVLARIACQVLWVTIYENASRFSDKDLNPVLKAN